MKITSAAQPHVGNNNVANRIRGKHSQRRFSVGLCRVGRNTFEPYSAPGVTSRRGQISVFGCSIGLLGDLVRAVEITMPARVSGQSDTRKAAALFRHSN
jgi:hypothetical protein